MDGIPLGEMNTSMTINATAAWLLALYIVTAEEQGVAQEQLQGTTQNDIIKEFLARGTYAFPPAPSMRLIADMIAYTVEHVPRWNPINICSYHLQEAGATPVQEIAYAMSNAIAVLDAARERVRARAHGTGLRAHLVLRQRRRALHRGARQAARDVDPVGAARPRALRRPGPAPPALPLRRAGQLAGPDRGPAREQRAADRARGAGRDARARRARPRDPAAGLERGARPAAAVGPAVVAAHPAGAGLRNRHPRVRGHLRGLEGDGGARGGAARGRPRGDGRRRRARRRRRGRPLHEGGAGGLPPRAAAPDRERRAGRGRPEPLRPRPRSRRSPPTPRAASWSSTRRSKPSRSRPSGAWRAERDEAAVEQALAAARAGGPRRERRRPT